MRTFRWTLALVFLALCLTSGTTQALTGCAELESRWGRGLTLAVVHSAGTVYYGTGTELVAVSASTDAEIGRLDIGGVIHAIVVDGTHAYVAGSKRGLIVVDVSDPTQMLLLAHTDEPMAAIAVNGSTAWIAADYGGYHAVDISNTAAPVLVGSANSSVGTPTDIDVAGSRVWLANWNAGATVVEVVVSSTRVSVVVEPAEKLVGSDPPVHADARMTAPIRDVRSFISELV